MIKDPVYILGCNVPGKGQEKLSDLVWHLGCHPPRTLAGRNGRGHGPGPGRGFAQRAFGGRSLIGGVGFLSIGLGMAMLWLFDYPIGFMAIIGQR